MPWFRVDDNFAMHQKAHIAGNAAIGLWCRAGSWAMQQLSDGFIPDHMVTALGTKAQAERLVAAGLWDRLPTGYAFHQWDDRQITKSEVEAERAENARRQAEYRERKRKEREDARNTRP